ncbi:phosphoribosylanthranilate isomerase [Thiogranum longum]|uniref:N-(5'-phosphoribosyl)anthranilate isomerase n=1 Tax=Thiogranum longum TaxID=1537524 RepID=A0A4R1HC14_9GAMM|nr:phosphoribosylanthranilate isomerase [Thiogranum longum]TCK17775.1 phosphoribosylanthranilate isomerase [Thiogranum longum]
MRTRVKICGITRAQDGQAAAQAGADAIGLVFYASSPRYVEPQQAAAICAALPPFVSVVGLFVNAPRKQVEAVLQQVPIDLLQFHGNETADQCEGFGRPYIKAIGMKDGVDVAAQVQAHPNAGGFLLDAWQPDIHGGGGVAFDWTQVPATGERPVILAGGLAPDNVEQAIRQTRPWAVDVSSGVEQDKGIKSVQKIEAFIRGVVRGDTMQ